MCEIAAPARRDRRGEEHIGDGCVIAVGEDDRRLLRPGKPSRRDKISWHRRALERDGLAPDWRIVQREARVVRPRVVVESRQQSRIDRRAIDRMVGGRIEGAGSQIEFPRALLVSALCRRFRRGGGAVPPSILALVKASASPFPTFAPTAASSPKSGPP